VKKNAGADFRCFIRLGVLRAIILGRKEKESHSRQRIDVGVGGVGAAGERASRFKRSKEIGNLWDSGRVL